jgi:hypothetical protein
MTVTIEHYECRMSHATMSRMPKPTVTTATMPDDHIFEWSHIGEPSTDWLETSPVERVRQFTKRDLVNRIDHMFVVTLRTGA